MPNLDAPLAQSLDVLLAHAARGDPVAACRAVLDVQTCWNRAALRSRARKFAASALEATSDIERDRFVRLSASYDEKSKTSEDLCAGATGFGRADFEGLVANGREQMNTWQRLLLVMTNSEGRLIRIPVNRSSETSEILATNVAYPQFLVDLDLPTLEQGIREAQPLALEGKIILHLPSLEARSLGLRQALPDPFLFARYALMMKELYGDESVGPLVDDVLVGVLMRMSQEHSGRLHHEVDEGVRAWRAVDKTVALARKGDAAMPASSLCSAG